MDITFAWSWFSFIIGFVACLTVAFWAIVAIAFKQYKKQKQQTSSMDELFKGWSGGKTP
jgi:uncharacterized membrane protein YwzB